MDATAEAEADANPACIPGVVEAVQWSSSVVLYVVDRSGSMNCNSPPVQTTLECTASPKKKDVAQPSKWELSRDALLSALTNLESTTPLPSAGLMLFANNDSCGAPTAASPGLGPLSSSQHDSFALALNAVVPKGDSPVVMTTVSAYQLLHATTGSGNKYVVLLTDSGESCLGSTDFLVQKAAEAHALGIRTFVLGAPGSEVARGFLSRVAFAGGTASSSLCDHTSIDSAVGDCHLDMTQPGLVFADELAKALQRTGDAAKSCEFEVPLTDGGKADPNKVNVTYKPLSGAGSVIPKDEVHPCNTGNLGWQYTDSTSTKIRICGPQCEAIRTDPAAEVSVEIGCATVVAM